MHRRTITQALAIATGVLIACGSADYATWPVGLEITGQATLREFEREFVHREGDTPRESKGFIAAGTFANDSSGEKWTLKERIQDSTWNVVGQTRLDNPLVPGDPAFSGVPVAVVEAVTVENGFDETFETFVTEPESGVRHTLEESGVQPVVAETTATTFGLAGDEYIVMIENLALLWTPDLVETWRGTGTPLPGVEHLVRRDVSVGDFWVSPDGTILYKAVARESVDIGNRTVTAVKVELRQTGNALDAIFSQCLAVTERVDSRWTLDGPRVPDEGDVRTLEAGINPGCEDDFTHYRVGFEWWYQNVLVAADTTTHKVTINDYGFEWTTNDGVKTRKTARQLRANAVPADARLFVQYTFATEHRVYRTTSWTSPGTPWSE